MSTPRRSLFCIAISLVMAWVFLGAGISAPARARKKEQKQPPPVIQVNPPPPVMQNTLPTVDPRTQQSSLSVDSAANPQGYVKFSPYNTFPRELNLWGLEGRHFVRSEAVIAPEKDMFAYSETIFVAPYRQTKSRLYLVPVEEPVPVNLPQLPSEQVQAPPPPPPEADIGRFDPDKTFKRRQNLVNVGYEKIIPYDFRTLTVVDWSTTGQRLLVKQRSGVLHVGLRTSDIIVYDRTRGTVTIYPELQRAIKYYWMNTGNLPHMEELSWDIQPLGWEVGSDEILFVKAWAYDKNEKKFLGVWRYDVDAERTELIALEDQPVTVAANGLTASFSSPPPQRNGVFSYRKPKSADSSQGEPQDSDEQPSTFHFMNE